MNPLGSLLFIFTAIFVVYALITVAFRTRRLRIRVTSKLEGNLIRIAVFLAIAVNWAYLILVGR